MFSFWFDSVYFVSEIRKILEKNTKKSGKTIQNEFLSRVLAQNVILELLIMKNPRDSTIQTSISIFLDHIRARIVIFLEFLSFFFGRFSARIASPYRKPIPGTPGYHPSL